MNIFTIAEAAGLLKCSNGIVKKLIESGRLAARDLASPESSRRNYRISQEAIDAFLREDAPKPQPGPSKSKAARPVLKTFMRCARAGD